MIFLVSKDPFEAVSLQNLVSHLNLPFLEVFLSIEEAELNLYKLPDIVLLDSNLPTTDLLYLTQSIKAYEPGIEVVWVCQQNCIELERLYKGYGVYHCLKKGENFPERLSLLIIEINNKLNRSSSKQKRKEYLRRKILDKPSS